ncbi:MAG: ABC transporter permease [Clostridiales bacterium]|nr:ABC transporter permease [Clostridiales bacterium]
MNILDTFIMAFTNLTRRKLRTVLTALGMAVGTISIVVMISVGIGFQRSFEEQLKNFGSLNQVTVYPGWDSATGRQKELDDKLIKQIGEMEHVTAVLPIINQGGNLKSGRNRGWAQLYGVDFSLAETFGFMPTTGELPGGHSGRNSLKVVMTADIGYDMEPPRRDYRGVYMWTPYEEREPNVDLMEDKILFSFDWGAFESNAYYDEGQSRGKIYTLDVTGILDNISGGTNYWNAAFVDLATMEALCKENKDFTNYDPKRSQVGYLLLMVDDMDNVASVVENIRAQGLEGWGNGEWISQQQQSVKMIQNVLGIIGAVAMLVAAIGIMNTMLMSIIERTREIGVIKVLGCRMGNILQLFLFEAACIGLLGGGLGLGLSYGLSYIINNLAQLFAGSTIMWFAESYNSVIPPWLALAGVSFSALVALVSGLYPAIRAMRLSALEAIRNQ